MDKPIITLDDFKKIDIKIGHILSAEKVPETDKLLRLSVDFGEVSPRQIISGIATHFPNPEDLVHKKCAFVANLEPRKIKGFESQGMILAVSSGEEGAPFFSLLSSTDDIPPGTSAK